MMYWFFLSCWFGILLISLYFIDIYFKEDVINAEIGGHLLVLIAGVTFMVEYGLYYKGLFDGLESYINMFLLVTCSVYGGYFLVRRYLLKG